MELYPGGPRELDGQLVLDDVALQDSMAKAIEDALAELFSTVKGTTLSDTGKQDRRLLFVAITRGILKYLKDHESDILADISVQHATGPIVDHDVDKLELNVVMDK